MGIEFLGNKKQLEGFLMDNLSPYILRGKLFMDLFSGSGSVSMMMKKQGLNVIANDFLFFSSMMTKAVLENGDSPQFNGLKKVLSLRDADPYGQVIHYLNSLCGEEGFIFAHYSPASLAMDGIARMYFTEENAKKIDAVRNQIELWTENLLPEEKALLISDLLDAVSGVSNIAGTYGCYMKFWKKKALCPMNLSKRELIEPCTEQRFLTLNAYSNDIVSEYKADVIYMDPPYTKRQYSAYYHILETIALNDSPNIFGKTGLRDWKKKSSDYCYKRKASKALADLLDKANCQYFVMSYNNEGQIEHEEILRLMKKHGQVSYYETPYRRYKRNTRNAKADEVMERLYILEMR